MRRDAAADVAANLAQLRAAYRAETIAEARARLARERPRIEESFDRRVGRALDELRALNELARYLQSARFP